MILVNHVLLLNIELFLCKRLTYHFLETCKDTSCNSTYQYRTLSKGIKEENELLLLISYY